MNIVSIDSKINKRYVGSETDGSDRQEITDTTYQVIVEEGGTRYEAVLPADDEQTIVDAFAAGLFTEIPKTSEQLEIASLKAENLELKLAMAELAETQEADKLTTQLALAELAELIAGGA